MGYDFHITRAQDWTQSPSNPIEVGEWEELADRSGLVEEGEPREWLDIGLQKGYSVPGETAVFSWRRGRIDIVGRYTDRTERAAGSLAAALEARVLGDDD